MEMRGYLSFLRRRWWLLMVGPALACAAAYFVSQQITPVYKATAQLFVVNQTTGQQSELNSLEVDERLTNTYVKLINRRPVLQGVIDELSLALSVDDLERKISVSVVEETQLINLSVDDVDPGLAATVANTTAKAFVSDINVQLGESGGVVLIAEEAAAPSEPFKPNLRSNLLLAGVLGIMVAGGIAMALEYLDDTVKSGDDVESLELTTIGEVSRFRNVKGLALEASDFQSRHAEAYRQLRTNIHFTNLGASLKTIVVTSANPNEGKSTTASNLAAVLAQAGDRVILVDADLRRSSLRKTFLGPTSFGLTGLLYNDVNDPALALVSTRWQNLRLLPAGVLPPNPSELLTSTRMRRIVEKLRGMADYVIFDTPPILAVTDAIVLAARTDGTIVVVEAGKTRTEALREAARSLSQANAKPLGVVLNKARSRNGGHYYYREEGGADPVEIVADPAAECPQVQEQAPLPPYIARNAPGSPAERLSLSLPLDASANDGTPAESLPRRDLEPETSPGVPAQMAPAGAVQDAQSKAKGEASANGNGNGYHHLKAQPLATLPLSAAVSDLLSHLDDTVGLIRSLKPGEKGEEPQDL